MNYKFTWHNLIIHTLTAFSIILITRLIYFSRFISLVFHDFLGTEFSPHVFVYVFNKGKFTLTNNRRFSRRFKLNVNIPFLVEKKNLHDQ